MSPAPLGLVCPACRRLDDQGRLVVYALAAEPGGCLGCAGCGQVYPVIDGIPVVVPALDAYLAAEAPVLLARVDLPEAVAARLLRGVGGPLGRDARLQRVYGPAEEAPENQGLYAWARAALADSTGEVLHLGGGRSTLGLGARALHMDLNFSLLRAAAAARRVVGDALNPPLVGGRFGAVAALNLLDSCRQPGLLLQQLDALLAPQGTLVLSCAFAWQEEVTAPAAQITEAHLQGFLAERRYQAVYGEQVWVLRHSARSESRYQVMTVHARKPGLV